MRAPHTTEVQGTTQQTRERRRRNLARTHHSQSTQHAKDTGNDGAQRIASSPTHAWAEAIDGRRWLGGQVVHLQVTGWAGLIGGLSQLRGSGGRVRPAQRQRRNQPTAEPHTQPCSCGPILPSLDSHLSVSLSLVRSGRSCRGLCAAHTPHTSPACPSIR